MSSDWAKVLAFSCVHHPIDDKEMTAWRNEQIAEYRPDVVMNLGDWMDADAASRWPNEHEWTLKDEYRAVAEDAENIRRAAGAKARLVWMLGNHDDNLRVPCRISKKLRDVASWENDPDMREALDGWTVVGYGHRQFMRLGQVTFQHGAEVGVNAERNQALLYGVENGLWVGGHTHRPLQITPVVLPGRIPLRYSFCNVGCGCDWEQMQYVKRMNIALWGHAVVKLRLNLSHHRHSWATRQWAGDPGVVVRKMVAG